MYKEEIHIEFRNKILELELKNIFHSKINKNHLVIPWIEECGEKIDKNRQPRDRKVVRLCEVVRLGEIEYAVG